MSDDDLAIELGRGLDEDDEVPTVAIAQAVAAGVRPTLTEWLNLSPEVRWFWAAEASAAPIRFVEELMGALRGAVDAAAIRSALDRAHAAEVAAAARRAP